jgi:hypothetical protein
MITEQQVIDELGLDTGTDVSRLLGAAQALVMGELGDSYCPQEIVDQAVLMLCSELNMRKSNPGGIVNYAGQDTTARLNKDPMAAVRPIYAAFVVKL